MTAPRRFAVGEGRSGERLDRFLAAEAADLSRARLQQLIEQGQVWVDGRAATKAGVRLKEGAAIELVVPPPEPVDLRPTAMGLVVLYEDAHLAVIDKPPGIAVHPGAGVRSATLVHGLLHQLGDLAGIGGELRPGIVHRLDKDTSGCLVVAKTEAALRGLQAAFKARQVDKRYRAIVHGQPADQGTIDAAIARHPTDRKRFSSRVREGRQAITRYVVLARAPAEAVGGAGAAWVEVELLTGRTHQIRVHFADAGHPLLADVVYGGAKRETRLPEDSLLARAAQAAGRQALHAARLAFDHPITGARIACVAPLPLELRASLALLGIHERADSGP